MSDNHRRYSSIRKALVQMYQKEPKGYTAKQLNVLTAMISGIVGSRRTNYPQIACLPGRREQRLSFAQKPSCRSQAPGKTYDCCMPGLSLDCIS